jgi:hypothetical protein
MIAEEQDEFKEVMIGLGEYYGKEITEALTKIYWYDLKPLTIDQFKLAASQHRLNPDNGQFFPKSADIVKIFTGNSKQQEQLLDDTAQMQWLVILSEIRKTGSYGNLKIEDQQAMAAVESLGGWKLICSKTEADLVWFGKKFVEAYKNFERTDISLLPNKLAGRIEIENHKQNKQPSLEFSRIQNGIKQHRLNNKES